MKRKINHNRLQAGERYGMLTILEYSHTNRHTYYKCQCDCGNVKVMRRDAITSSVKTVHSCGCHQYNKIRKTKSSRLIDIFRDMNRRCYDEKRTGYSNYGGRGITICDEWLNDYTSFENWAINNGYNDNLTIDRIDVNGNYEPSNCRWVDRKTQNNNKRNNRHITYNGETKTLMEWSEHLNIPYGRLKNRLRRGWDIERTFTTDINPRYHIIEYNGECKPLIKWCEELNLEHKYVLNRIQRGWTPIQAFEIPKGGKRNE